MEISELHPKFAESVDEILAEARAELVRPEERLASASDRIADADADPLIVARVGLVEGRVAAFIEWQLDPSDPELVTLATIAVAAAHRDRGVGKELLLKTLSELLADRPGLRVTAGVHADNRGAIAFFTALGFDVTHRSRGVVDVEAPAHALL